VKAAERRAKILDLLAERGAVRASELARLFKVSEVTVRKDLAVLEREGLLKRVHGGAVSRPRALFNPSFEEKRYHRIAEKKAIAKEALSRIEENDALLLDAGTTTLALAQQLKKHFSHLFVITNSIPIALELAGTPFELILTGGTVRHHSGALIGPVAVEAIDRFQVDKAFLGATGVCLTKGYTTPNPIEAQTKRAMVLSARRKFVLADSSKLGHATLARFAKLEEIDELITDAGAPAGFVEQFRKQGHAIVVVPVDPDDADLA